MSERLMIDRKRFCPDCGTQGRLQYEDMVQSMRQYVVDGDAYTDHYNDTRDYHCLNCDCQFTLTDWEG